jgi:hypothetical protein
MSLLCFNQMVHIFFVNILYAKIVHHKSKRDGSGFMTPETRCVLAFYISEWGKFSAWAFVGKDAGLHQAPHRGPYLDMYPANYCQFFQVVLFDRPQRKH